jgi:hypothetical protein
MKLGQKVYWPIRLGIPGQKEADTVRMIVTGRVVSYDDSAVYIKLPHPSVPAHIFRSRDAVADSELSAWSLNIVDNIDE